MIVPELALQLEEEHRMGLGLGGICAAAGVKGLICRSSEAAVMFHRYFGVP
jgi:hypothetical protein